jgi:methyltransferase-like protein
MINKLVIVLQHIHRRQEVSKLRSQKNGKCHWVLKSSELRSMAHACKYNDSIDLRWKRCDMDQKSAFKNNVSPSEIKTKNSWKLALAVIWNSIPNSLDFEEISYNATSANIRHLEIRDAWEEKYLEHNHNATNCTWFYTFSLQLKMWILSTTVHC